MVGEVVPQPPLVQFLDDLARLHRTDDDGVAVRLLGHGLGRV